MLLGYGTDIPNAYIGTHWELELWAVIRAEWIGIKLFILTGRAMKSAFKESQ